MMNHIMPMRNDLSTWSLNRPAWFSLMTVENQPKNSTASSSAPGTKDQAGAQSLRNATAPHMTQNSAMEPTIGQGLLCGT